MEILEKLTVFYRLNLFISIKLQVSLIMLYICHMNAVGQPPIQIELIFYSHFLKKIHMDHNFEEPNGIQKPDQYESNRLNGDSSNFHHQKIQIQVATKKKKQVIRIDSSSQKIQSEEQSPQKQVEPSAPKQPKKAKVKKVQHKCQLCKVTGKKVEMKKCSSCKHYIHIHCLDENEVKGKLICDRCKAANHAQENKAIKKQKKQEQKIQIAKATQKKIQKEKKKDESLKILEKFRQKYPYYFGEGDKIKFPIEDKFLFIYKECFESTQNRILPSDHPLIPSKYLGNLLQLQNFIVSFRGEFSEDYDGDYQKSALYILMNCNGSDKTFQNLLGAIIKIYLKDIFQKNKTENVKILNDNCFFILLGTINDAQQMTSDYVSMTAPEIIRNLSSVPSMKNSFADFQFPERLSLESKLKILISLVQGLSQVDGFHDMVSKKSEKISEMTKNKADFIVKLKKNQAEALSNKQKLKEMLNKINKLEGKGEQIEEQLKQKDKNTMKQAEKTKKKSQKLASEGHISERVIKQFKDQIVSITKKIPFVISEILFLGSDRNESHYFFYLREPHRIYVRYRNYMLDDNEEYKIYETKEKITELLKSLNTKGTHEKRLYDSIHSLMKEDIIRNLSLEDQLKLAGTDIEQPSGECVFVESDAQFRLKVISDIMQIQQKFSNYLAIKNYRWAAESKRQQFRFGFPYIQDLNALKQQIKNLQESFLFVEVVRDREAARDESDSNEYGDRQNAISFEKQFNRRKKPIRIWGINSERIKKFWIEYLETCVNYTGIWISVNIFKNYVDKYIDKKMEYIREQEKKQNQQREKQLRQRRIRQQRERQKEERNLDRLRSRDRPKLMLRKKKSASSPIEQQMSDQNGIVSTRRALRASNRSKNRQLTIDSDSNDEQDPQHEPEDQEESDNDDQCDICKDTGQVICCDTCPKVFHLGCLGLKETPEGEWSCMDCLHKINNQRQTRSRAKKMSK